MHDCAKAAGAVSVTLVPAPLAAAAGADLPVREPVGSLLIDVGAGRTQVAVLSLGGIVVRGSVPVAGDALDASIVDWVRRERGVAVGERAAEELKIQVASLTPSVHADLRWRVRGRAEATGHPEEVEVDAEGLADALEEPVSRIRRVLRDTLGQVPPELAGDIVERGLWTCGGTSKLRGLDAVLRHDTAMPVLQPEAAEHCAIRGAARMLEDVRWLERIGRAPG